MTATQLIGRNERASREHYQDNRCAICGEPPPPNRRLAIDHNHTTGQIRDLLCTRCNAGLGMFNDDTALLERAAEYLTYHATAIMPDCCDHCGHSNWPTHTEASENGGIFARYRCDHCGNTHRCWWGNNLTHQSMPNYYPGIMTEANDDRDSYNRAVDNCR